MRTKAALIAALLLAGCGGGGGEETAVSASPPAPAATPPESAVAAAPGAPVIADPVAAAPAVPPAPIAAPAPAAPKPAAPPAVTPPAPPAASPPPAGTVPGMLVWSALQTGISPDPQAVSPYTSDRKVYTAEGAYYYFGGAMRSYLLAQVPWLQNRSFGFKIVADHEVNVQMVGSDGVIDSVVANGIALSRFANPSRLDLRSANVPLDSVVAEWRDRAEGGQWFAQLLAQSDKPGHARVCWNVHLPPPPPLESDDPDYVPHVRTAPLKRIMCGIYSATAIGPDVGGQVIDDRGAGELSTMRAEW